MSSPLIHRLPNGLTLVVTEQPHLHAVALSYTVRCGARHDPKNRPGLSHFVEHMMFRGSERFPSPKALITPFEQAGGTLAAETWRDHTHFSATLHPTKLVPALNALGDMMARPSFLGLDAERALIEAELFAELGEDGEDADLCNASRAAVWPGHVLGRRIVGTGDSIARMTLADIRRHHARFYGAKNTVLGVAGRVDAQEILRVVHSAFGRLPSGARTRVTQAPDFTPQGLLDAVNAQGSQLSLALTFPGVPESHPTFIAQELLCAILDDGMNSRLHRALSERRGLVYNYDSGLDCYADAGLYELEMQVAPSRLHAAVQETLKVFASIVRHGVSAAELTVAKDRAKMAFELGQDSCEDVAHQSALDVLFKRPTAEQWHARVAAVTVPQLHLLARQIFGSGRMHAMLMGPLNKISLPDLKTSLKHFCQIKNSPATPAASYRSPAVGRKRRKRAGHADTSHGRIVAAPVPTL